MQQIQSALAEVTKMVEDQIKDSAATKFIAGEIAASIATPNVTCSSTDYSKAVGVDMSFVEQLAAKYCEGTTDSATLTGKDIGSSAYGGYSFHFDHVDGGDCPANCTDAYNSAITACMLSSIMALMTC